MWQLVNLQRAKLSQRRQLLHRSTTDVREARGIQRILQRYVARKNGMASTLAEPSLQEHQIFQVTKRSLDKIVSIRNYLQASTLQVLYNIIIVRRFDGQ